MELKELLMFMTKKNASDLHIKPMRPPLLRIQGRLIPVKSSPLKPDEVQKMLCSILTPKQKELFDQHLSVDIGYGIPGVARFRANLFYQRGTIAGVFRRVPFDIQNVADLNLPDVIDTFTDFPGGMVLVTGPTGSGKTTTMYSALLERRNPEINIVTVEELTETARLALDAGRRLGGVGLRRGRAEHLDLELVAERIAQAAGVFVHHDADELLGRHHDRLGGQCRAHPEHGDDAGGEREKHTEQQPPTDPSVPLHRSRG